MREKFVQKTVMVLSAEVRQFIVFMSLKFFCVAAILSRITRSGAERIFTGDGDEIRKLPDWDVAIACHTIITDVYHWVSKHFTLPVFQGKYNYMTISANHANLLKGPPSPTFV